MAMSKKRPTLEEQKNALLEAHKKKLSQINEKIKDQETREREKERKLDTRRKIIIGGLARNHMEKNKSSEFAKLMHRLMDEYVVKDADRSLFDLPPLPEDEQKLRLEKHLKERKIRKDIESVNNG